MLNQHMQTNDPLADQATFKSLIDDWVYHKRQGSEDSGMGEGNPPLDRMAVIKPPSPFQAEPVLIAHPMH